MANIPALAFHATDKKKNLDTAIKFYVAGARKTAAIAAAPTATPPRTAVPVGAGVALALAPHFSYESKVAANGTDWNSKFTCLIELNEKLEVASGSALQAVVSIPGIASCPYFKADGVAAPAVAGITAPSLEQMIYSLALENTDVTATTVMNGLDTYLKLSADYTFTPAGGEILA